MKTTRPLLAAGILLLATAGALHAHDLFFRLQKYFVAPGTAMRLPVLNGTFSRSANSIDWSRVIDLSVTGPAGRVKMDSAAWDTRTDTSYLSYTPKAAGTYVVGLSTHPKELDQTAAEFNKYLVDDGMPDILTARRANGTMNKAIHERYHKHVKAVFQVGDTRTDAWKQVLGYPSELVPLANPYSVARGGTLDLQCLVDGKPMPNQYVMIGGRRPDESRLPMRHTRCDTQGVAHVTLDAAGIWYVKFIRMKPVTDGADYESSWASITFGVR